MNADVKNTLARVANWPEEDQEELAQIALEIEARRHGVYHATPEELAVRRVAERIGQFPEGAQEVAERPGVRRVPLLRYPYVVHYIVYNDEVLILRIVHGARRSPWE